jgi:predicted nucleotidyltransferase
MIPIIESHMTELAALCRRFGVRRLDLFGSAASGGFKPESSDLDFLVEFDPAPPGKRADQYFGFLGGLELLFARPVHLAEEGTIQNPYVLASVQRSRVPLYAAA